MQLKNQSLIQPDSAFINGKWYRPESDQYFDVINPATSQPVAKVPDLDEKQCTEAVDAAVKAAVQLKNMTGKQRAEILRRWFNLLHESRDDLATIITAENGKPLAEARGEVVYASDFVDWFAGEATRIDGTVHQASASANRIITIKQPVGVVGIITPWNFPAAMITRKVGAAIAAGCPCVVKPAAETPLTALALAHLAYQAGLPAGALSIVTTLVHTASVGKVLTQHPSIRKFSFTGSTAVGKLLAAQCTTTMKKVNLELGGNAPFIVFDDADVSKAVDGIVASKFRLSGQTCVCVNRLYVQSGVHDRIVEALIARVNQFRLGPGDDPKTTLGPLISKKAAEKVAAHTEDAVKRGGHVLTGGEVASDLGEAFFQPTIVTNVAPDALCARSETFGPFLPILRFGTEDEVVQMANSTEVGLAGYFFTENISRAWRVAEALEVGMVGVNTGLISDVASPFGGVKESGQGREGSRIGIDEYLEVKSMTFAVNN
ncbi:aldehyde dehydrogenase domain-containing protein [Talaromyces proteolyticus]|uniref:Succinate-semialdehyde dehydrogenase, mitochondrial n=1 Tax=Talaromyces proteolyticus TaxID=1131652 RepID=A0AAD4PWQ3_9EURO|nr:aldehyde dehydrogenase domain-containing protein [Talaromyces proteolyticus]KAH8692217.1 aldehyde dehydrogenase domain-containing protein [Talaromyces proteolyticus]